MLNQVKSSLRKVSTLWDTIYGFLCKYPFVSVFIACGSIIISLFLTYFLSDTIEGKLKEGVSFTEHFYFRSLLHLGFGGILARSVFFGLTQIDNNIKHNFGYKSFFGLPVLTVVIIAFIQEFVYSSGGGFGGDFSRNVTWQEHIKSFGDMATWTISSAYAMWTLYRNCDLAYAAKLQYLQKRKKLTVDNYD